MKWVREIIKAVCVVCLTSNPFVSFIFVLHVVHMVTYITVHEVLLFIMLTYYYWFTDLISQMIKALAFKPLPVLYPGVAQQTFLLDIVMAAVTLLYRGLEKESTGKGERQRSHYDKNVFSYPENKSLKKSASVFFPESACNMVHSLI